MPSRPLGPSRRAIAAIVVLAAVPLAGGCGDEGPAAFHEQPCPPLPPEAEGAEATVPGWLPLPPELRLATTAGAGATRQWHGFLEGTEDVAAVHAAIDERIDGPGYEPVFSEVEAYDTEIAFRHDGQLAMVAARVVCDQRLDVRIGIQPAPTDGSVDDLPLPRPTIPDEG